MSRALVAPPSSPRAQLARGLLVLGCLTLALAMLGLSRSVEAVSNWFYDLCWWSYIVLADALIYLRDGRSLLISKPRTFVLMSVWSAAFWLAFEVANLRLENWYYVGIPSDWISRGPGVFISFATVLPGLFETKALFTSFRWAESWSCTPRSAGHRARRMLFALGWIWLIVSLAWPTYFYPLIWGVPVLLGEPWLDARGSRGLLSAWRAGDPRPLVRMLAAGAACGLLWESWNYWATAKWIYTVPFFDELKLFEMPILGFIGFLPFAVAGYTFGRVLVELGWLPEWELDLDTRSSVPAARAWIPAVAALTASIPMIAAVNTFTLHATTPLVREIPGIDLEFAGKMERGGLRYVRPWLRAASTDAAWKTSVSRVDLEAWIASAELMEIRGLGARGIAWLRAAGVRTVPELARRAPEDLDRSFDVSAHGPDPRPTLAELRVWVRGARRAAVDDAAHGTE